MPRKGAVNMVKHRNKQCGDDQTKGNSNQFRYTTILSKAHFHISSMFRKEKEKEMKKNKETRIS
jgi:hypothetical protein